MTRPAHRVDLHRRKGLRADDLEALRHLALSSRLAQSDMLLSRTMADLQLVPARPRRAVRGRFLQIVVGGQLAHVAAVAGSIERVHRVRPVHGRIGSRTGK